MTKCKCGNDFEEKKYGKGALMCSSCVSNRRRFTLKRQWVDYLGGKCSKCGYGKCLDALEFDHKNPDEKEFGLSGRHTLKWERIKKELDKCILLCANCHRERHYQDNIKRRFGEEEIAWKLSTIKFICETCGEQFEAKENSKRRFCSHKCSNVDRIKIEWPSIDDLTIQVQESSFVVVGSRLGVSDNSVRKYLRRNGVNPKDIRSIKDNKFK